MNREVRRYYLEQKVNIHNKDSFFTFEIKQKIENLRDHIRCLTKFDGKVSFVPNEYIARQILLANNIGTIEVLPFPKETNSDVFIINLIQGITALCYRVSLVPYYVSYSSISFINGYNLIFSNKEWSLECGTMNIPLLLYLEKHFRSKISNG